MQRKMLKNIPGDIHFDKGSGWKPKIQRCLIHTFR